MRLMIAAVALALLLGVAIGGMVGNPFEASAEPAVPNPGHSWNQIELPPGTWPGLDADTLDGQDASAFWNIAGNGGTSPGADFLGTTDNQALELHVNGGRALRLEPNAASPNIVGGFSGNSATSGSVGATVGGGGSGGSTNLVTDSYGTVGGGQNNQAGDNAGSASDENFATVAGGADNTASAHAATVAGGEANRALDDRATVAGGSDNLASGFASTVVGGRYNNAYGWASAAGGGRWNNAWGQDSTVAGGNTNSATDDYASIGGGANNQAGDGAGDTTNATHATVGGGDDNTASAWGATVGGGWLNAASGGMATVGGGQNNSASDFFATVGGGENNAASDQWATIAGGNGNIASEWGAAVGGGENNLASGFWASVPGGQLNTAAGDYSFAAGSQAKVAAAHDGSFLFADDSSFDFNSSAANEFAVRSTGGARFVSAIDGSGNPTAGVSLAPGGTSWSAISDRNLKANFSAVDGLHILEALASVPIETWNLKSQDASIRHIGPMAQDFYAAFSVGEDDRHITTIDADGVALAAIQGLYELSQEQTTRIEALEAENADLHQQLDDLETRVTALDEGGGGTPVSRASSSGLPSAWLLLGGGLALFVLGVVLVQRRLAGGR